MPGMTVRAEFTDPITEASCVLVVPAGGRVWPRPGEPKIGVEHPGCPELADLCVDLDAFYCPAPAGCGWNGRVSGAWALDVMG
jgi:hypothetical protein